MLSTQCAALVAELQSLAPMPNDEILDRLPLENHPLEKLDRIFTLLEQETQVEYPFELIVPLLEVFGVGEGYEMYWSILHFIERCPHPEELYPIIQQATRSANDGTRMWSCLLLGRRRNKEDEPFFIACLQDEVAQVRHHALVGISMLAQCYDMKYLLSVVEPLLQDQQREVRLVARNVMEALGTPATADGSE